MALLLQPLVADLHERFMRSTTALVLAIVGMALYAWVIYTPQLFDKKRRDVLFSSDEEFEDQKRLCRRAILLLVVMLVLLGVYQFGLLSVPAFAFWPVFLLLFVAYACHNIGLPMLKS